MFRHSTLTRFSLAFMVFFSSPSWANDSNSANPASKLPVWAIADVWPWGYTEQELPQGLLVRLTEHLMARSGVDAHIIVRPYVRTLQGLADGNIDLAYAFTDPTSAPTLINLGAIVNSATLLTTLSEPSSPPPVLTDFIGKPVGYIRGTYYGEEFAQNEQIIKVPAEDAAQVMLLLARGRVDAVVTTEQAVYYAAPRMGIPAERLNSQIIRVAQTGYLYGSPHSAFRDQFDVVAQSLSVLRSNGELEKIFQISAVP